MLRGLRKIEGLLVKMLPLDDTVETTDRCCVVLCCGCQLLCVREMMDRCFMWHLKELLTDALGRGERHSLLRGLHWTRLVLRELGWKAN